MSRADGGGGGSSIGMNPEPLHAAGGAIAGMKGRATSAKTSFLSAVSDGAGAVHHAKLAAALREYHTTWAKPAKQLPVAVESVGNKIKATAVDGVNYDAQAAHDVCYAPGGGTHAPGYKNPVLSRPIHAGR